MNPDWLPFATLHTTLRARWRSHHHRRLPTDFLSARPGRAYVPSHGVHRLFRALWGVDSCFDRYSGFNLARFSQGSSSQSKAGEDWMDRTSGKSLRERTEDGDQI